jgi:hypothetical protein
MYKMKKQNNKMLAYSTIKGQSYKSGMVLRLFLFMFMLFGAASVAVSDNITDAPKATMVMGGSATLATMALIGNIEDQTDTYTQPNQIAYEVVFTALEQVDGTVAFPQPNSSREVGAMTLKAGQVGHTFAAHKSPALSSTGEKGDYTVTPKKELEFVVANTFRESVLNFTEQYAGGKFIIEFRQIETTQWYRIGSYDKPVIFQSYELKLNDANVAIFKFSHDGLKQWHKCPSPSVAVPATIAADATALAITGASVYQLSDNTVATAIATISGVGAADVGRRITVVGGGGDHASTIADSSTFVLANGTTWTGNAGSSITFRILDTTSLVEISRVQTAA